MVKHYGQTFSVQRGFSSQLLREFRSEVQRGFSSWRARVPEVWCRDREQKQQTLQISNYSRTYHLSDISLPSLAAYFYSICLLSIPSVTHQHSSQCAMHSTARPPLSSSFPWPLVYCINKTPVIAQCPAPGSGLRSRSPLLHRAGPRGPVWLSPG